MGWVEPFLRSPYPFVGLAAVCLGAAIRYFLPLPRRRQSTLRSRRRAVAAGLFLLSFFLVFLTLALLVPGPERFFDLALVWFAAALVAITMVGLLFPVLVGLPLLLLYSVVLVVIAGYMHSWTAASAPVDVARFSVVAADAGTLAVEVSGVDTGQWEPLFMVFDLPGDALGAEVEVLDAHDAWILLGVSRSLRLTGIRGYRYSTEDGAFIPTDSRAVGVSLEPVDARVESFLRDVRLPGAQIHTLTGTPRRVGLLTRYTARYSPPGELVLAVDDRR